MLEVPRLVISAVRGGLGKTTVSLGLIAAWRKRGRRIAAFKKGPDFIDAGWLGAAAAGPCYNLDLFLIDEKANHRSFARHAKAADAAVVEGNRGLFDGVDASGTYSTARLARLLGAPVVLIVDCTKSSGTVAAVVLGCRQFDPAVDLQGVILNNVSPGRHETVVRQAIEKHTGVQVLGAVPRMRHGAFPERHMGLMPFQEHPNVARAIDGAAKVAEAHLDLDALWRVANSSAPITIPEIDASPEAIANAPVIGVIRDRAFQFYYPDNLEALEREGAVVREINALEDPALPELDALYIGGGFPETQAAELAANRSFCSSLRSAAENGLPVYAECGGLIYLGRSLRVGESTYEMTSVLPADFVLEKRPQAHGYTVLEAGPGNPFFEKGVLLRGHEFHYSRIENAGNLTDLAFAVQRGGGINGRSDGLVRNNVLGTYTHLHALGSPQWARSLVKKAVEYRRGRKAGVA